jgi:DNA-binding transcriptional MerR regulator
MHTIGQFSKLTQIPIKTLRYYDEIGLLRPAHVRPGTGYRYYTAEQFERLNRILVLKDLGCSLREIHDLVKENVSIRAMLKSKRAELEAHVTRERSRLARAAARLDLLETRDIAIRDSGSWLVASVRDTVPSHDECAGLFDELDWHLKGAPRERHRGVVWHACAPGAVDCEVFEVIPSPIDTGGRVRISETGSQRIASLVYRGDANYAVEYQAMRAWIAASGVAMAGPKREIFLDESATDLQFPIQ